MRRGLFAFVLVVSLLPVVLESLHAHHSALEVVAEAKQFMVEQQAMTNAELDFSSSFRQAVVHGARQDRLEASILEWKRFLEARGFRVWTGDVADDYYNADGQGFDASVARIEPGRIVVLRRDVAARISTGSTVSVAVIPRGVAYAY